MFECRKDHESVKIALENGIKNLTVFGLNMESLEFVSTVRREYPKVKITLIDDNKEPIIKEKYGEKVMLGLIKYPILTLGCNRTEV